MSFFGTAVPTLQMSDFAQLLAITSNTKQKRENPRLTSPLATPSPPPHRGTQHPSVEWAIPGLTRESGAAHQVRVGEVECGVEHEVGLYDPAGLLADVVEEPGALEWDTALIAILGREKG